ncbi:MAG TPA: TonB-dependent receptor [Verrucomicrobiae bacterium]|nr:TonB-dependent receptor [Verrucomicrobiae bacterium]
MRRTLLASAAMIAALSGAAYAQESEEIVVTAQRREQAVQDIGVAVSVVTSEALVNNGVTNVNGLENLAPSLEVESQFGGGQPSFSLRSVGFKDYASNNSPTVGVYVDDVAYTLPVLTQGVLFDVSRVEVLRGPQGTLYGRNTTGGAINVISNRPTQDFDFGGLVEYNNYGRVSSEGFVSGPLGGGAAARLSFATAHGGAWQESRTTGEELGDADRVALRGQLAIPVTDTFDVLLNLHGFQDGSDGLGLQLFKPYGVIQPHGDGDTDWGWNPNFLAENGLAADSKPFRDNEGLGASITANWQLGGANLTYIFSHEDLQRRELNDWDAVPGAIAGVYFETDARVTQHEFRLASDGDSAFDWLIGLYIGDEDLNDLYASDFTDSFGGARLQVPYGQTVETQAIFGQIEYQATQALNLVAGLRFEHENRELKDFGTFIGGGNVTGPTLINNSTGFDEFTGRLALEYTLSEDFLAYGSVSRGIKSGGFTAYNSFSPDAVSAFDPEELIAYEIGFKSDLLDQRLRLNGAVYYYDYRDQQVQNAIFLPTPLPARAVGRISNAPQSEIYGVELEAVWRATDALTISQTLGYSHGEFEEFLILDIAASNLAGAPVGRDASGERLGPAELTYSGAIAYEGELSSTWSWSGVLDYAYRGETDPPLLKAATGEGYGVPAYWLVNANLAVRPNEGPWEFALWGRNILDEDYDETRNFFAGVDWTPISAPGLPATYGVRIAYRR